MSSANSTFSGMYFRRHHPYRNDVRPVHRHRHPSPYVASTSSAMVQTRSAKDHGFTKKQYSTEDLSNETQFERWIRKVVRQLQAKAHQEHGQESQQTQQHSSERSIASKLQELRKKMVKLPKRHLPRFQPRSTAASTCSSSRATGYEKSIKRTRAGRTCKSKPSPKKIGFFRTKRDLVEREVVPWLADLQESKEYKRKLDLTIDLVTMGVGRISLENMLEELPDAPPLIADDSDEEDEEMSDVGTPIEESSMVVYAEPIVVSSAPVTPPAALDSDTISPLVPYSLAAVVTDAPQELDTVMIEKETISTPMNAALAHGDGTAVIETKSTTLPANAASDQSAGTVPIDTKPALPSTVAIPVQSVDQTVKSISPPADSASVTPIRHASKKCMPPPSSKAVVARPMLLQTTENIQNSSEISAQLAQSVATNMPTPVPQHHTSEQAPAFSFQVPQAAFNVQYQPPPSTPTGAAKGRPGRIGRLFRSCVPRRFRRSSLPVNSDATAPSNESREQPSKKAMSTAGQGATVPKLMYGDDVETHIHDIAELWKFPPNVGVEEPEQQPQRQLSHTQAQAMKEGFKNVWMTNPTVFETLVGMQFQTGRNPMGLLDEKLGQKITDHFDSIEFMIDTKRIDQMSASHGYDKHPKGYYRPENLKIDIKALGNAYDVYTNVHRRIQNNTKLFDGVVSEWALESEENFQLFTTIIDRAGWIAAENEDYWREVQEVKLLTDGEEKTKRYRTLLKQQPRTVMFMWEKLDGEFE